MQRVKYPACIRAATYHQIFFNHRFAFVMASDVDMLRRSQCRAAWRSVSCWDAG